MDRGLHPNDGRVVSNFIVQALLGRDLVLYGDGAQTRSFCFVDDLIDGLVRLMRTDDTVTGPINLGNPGEFTIRQLAERVVALTGSRSRIVHGEKPARRSAAKAARTSPRQKPYCRGSRAPTSKKGSKRRSLISRNC